MEKDIWSIVHLMDNYCNFLELEEFNNRHKVASSIEDYKKVIQSIPSALIQ